MVGFICDNRVLSALWGRKGNLDGLAMGNRQGPAGLGGLGSREHPEMGRLRQSRGESG